MNCIFIALVAAFSFAAAQECVDQSSYCFIYKFLCGYSWYKEWLKVNCKGTCPNFCPPEPKCGLPQVNMKEDQRGSSPWQVVLMLNGRPMCSGSLVRSKWVLTAAHCVDGLQSFANAFQVRVGEYNLGKHDGSEADFQVERIFAHPSYDPKTQNNDVSLIKLQHPVSTNKHVLPVCMPRSGSDLPFGSSCFVTGWRNFHETAIGKDSRLQNGRIHLKPKTMCGSLHKTSSKLTDHMICIKATKEGGCQGDSGGPFVCRLGPNDPWKLMGVVSWGSRHCSDNDDSFLVFAKVAGVRDWIDETMKSK